MSSTASTANACVQEMLPKHVCLVDSVIFMASTCLVRVQQVQQWDTAQNTNLFAVLCNFKVAAVAIICNHEARTISQPNIVRLHLWFELFS